MNHCPFCKEAPTDKVRQIDGKDYIGCFNPACSKGPLVELQDGETVEIAVARWNGLHFDAQRGARRVN
jgi:hypothetical protein